ncbi:hypothetical protein ES703_37696 [subsurface metagenome]
MRRIMVYTILIIPLILFPVCSEKIFPWDVDCDECYTIKPDSVDLVINWTKNNEYPEIPVLLYKGKVDVGEFIDTFFCFGVPAYIWVKANEEYSVRAIYASDDRTVMVVDGTNQKLKRVSDYCDEPCWVVTQENLYLELKY